MECHVCSLPFFKKKIFIFRQRKEETEKFQYLVPLTYAFIGCFLYVPCLGIEPTTLEYWDDAPPTALPGQGSLSYFSIWVFFHPFPDIIVLSKMKGSSEYQRPIHNTSMWHFRISQLKRFSKLLERREDNSESHKNQTVIQLLISNNVCQYTRGLENSEGKECWTLCPAKPKKEWKQNKNISQACKKQFTSHISFWGRYFRRLKNQLIQSRSTVKVNKWNLC